MIPPNTFFKIVTYSLTDINDWSFLQGLALQVTSP